MTEDVTLIECHHCKLGTIPNAARKCEACGNYFCPLCFEDDDGLCGRCGTQTANKTAENALKFIEAHGGDPTSYVNLRDLEELCYTMSEGGAWPDEVDSVSVGQVLMAWKMVQALHNRKLPEELRI